MGTTVETFSSPLAHLPLDLVYHTLRLASANSRKTALTCARVSSYVRRVTACELYHTVILRRPTHIAGFLGLLLQDDDHRGELPKGSISSRTGVNPGPYVRNLIITHHIPTPSSTPTSPSVLRASKEKKDPYAVIFALCPQISRAVLQSSFLHSSLVPGDPVNRTQWLVGRELVILGPVFPSDWEAHIEAIETPGSDISTDIGGRNEACSILSRTTHLTLLEPLSSPHVSARAIARLPRLTHIAIRVRPPHPLSTQANNAFVDILPLLASPTIIMVVVLLETTLSPNYSPRQIDVEEECRIWRQKVKDKERTDHLADLAREVDDRVYVVERSGEPSDDPVKNWRVESEEDVWERALACRKERNLRARSVA